MMAKGKPDGSVGYYVEHFTRAELADLDRALNDSLQGEIGMLRTVMRRFFERASQEADDLKALADVLRVLGLSCSRLAKVIQTERSFQVIKTFLLNQACYSWHKIILSEWLK